MTPNPTPCDPDPRELPVEVYRYRESAAQYAARMQAEAFRLALRSAQDRLEGRRRAAQVSA